MFKCTVANAFDRLLHQHRGRQAGSAACMLLRGLIREAVAEGLALPTQLALYIIARLATFVGAGAGAVVSSAAAATFIAAADANTTNRANASKSPLLLNTVAIAYAGLLAFLCDFLRWKEKDMKQSGCLKTNYHTHQKTHLGSFKYQSRAPSQDLINRLPEACIAEIFKRVENPEDRQSCASTCWIWAKILVSLGADFWGPFSVHQAVHPCLHLYDIVDAKLAAAVIDINTKEMITDLEIRCSPSGTVVAGVPRLSDNGIQFVTGVCRNLKSVRLINCSSLTEKAAMIIASNCPALQNLMMLWSSITDDGVSQVARQCNNLKSLHIEGSSYVTEASLRALVQDAKRLESLVLGSCPKIGEDAIMSFLLDHPYVDKFEIKDMMAGESHLSHVRKSSRLQRRGCSLRQLRSLILVKCPGLHDLSMLKFSDIHFRMLQHLVIDDCKGVTQLGLMWLVGNLSNPMKLKTIKLARFYFFTHAELIEVLSLFSRTIESIILDSCHFGLVRPLGLRESEVQKCPKLKVIRLENCKSVMSFFLEWVSMVCSGLEELRLIGFKADVKEHGISAHFPWILQNNRITKIEVRRSCQLTDIDVCNISKSCMGTLRELILDECCLIFGHCPLVHSYVFPNLIKLDLSRTQVMDKQIRILLALGYEHLEELNLMECYWITNKTLHILASYQLSLAKLERVNVTGCPRITQANVDYYQGPWEIEF
ncbi:hypothetical protein EJB05_10873, partial [Eragrostis curvula]